MRSSEHKKYNSIEATQNKITKTENLSRNHLGRINFLSEKKNKQGIHVVKKLQSEEVNGNNMSSFNKNCVQQRKISDVATKSTKNKQTNNKPTVFVTKYFPFEKKVLKKSNPRPLQSQAHSLSLGHGS